MNNKIPLIKQFSLSSYIHSIIYDLFIKKNIENDIYIIHLLNDRCSLYLENTIVPLDYIQYDKENKDLSYTDLPKYKKTLELIRHKLFDKLPILVRDRIDKRINDIKIKMKERKVIC